LANRWAPKSNPDYSRHAQQRLLAELRTLRDVADVLVLDVGSGLSSWTRRFWLRSRLVVLVTTTDDVAVMDAYAAIKLNVTESVAGDVRVLTNQCQSDVIANDVAQRLSTACQRFLGRNVPALPSLPLHTAIDAANTSRTPRVWESPNSPFAREVLWLAHAVDDVLSTPTTKNDAQISPLQII
jgi:flagellar biosynthesis protein FlhG